MAFHEHPRLLCTLGEWVLLSHSWAEEIDAACRRLKLEGWFLGDSESTVPAQGKT